MKKNLIAQKSRYELLRQLAGVHLNVQLDLSAFTHKKNASDKSDSSSSSSKSDKLEINLGEEKVEPKSNNILLKKNSKSNSSENSSSHSKHSSEIGGLQQTSIVTWKMVENAYSALEDGYIGNDQIATEEYPDIMISVAKRLFLAIKKTLHKKSPTKDKCENAMVQVWLEWKEENKHLSNLFDDLSKDALLLCRLFGFYTLLTEMGQALEEKYIENINKEGKYSENPADSKVVQKLKSDLVALLFNKKVDWSFPKARYQVRKLLEQCSSTSQEEDKSTLEFKETCFEYLSLLEKCLGQFEKVGVLTKSNVLELKAGEDYLAKLKMGPVDAPKTIQNLPMLVVLEQELRFKSYDHDFTHQLISESMDVEKILADLARECKKEITERPSNSWLYPYLMSDDKLKPTIANLVLHKLGQLVIDNCEVKEARELKKENKYSDTALIQNLKDDDYCAIITNENEEQIYPMSLEKIVQAFVSRYAVIHDVIFEEAAKRLYLNIQNLGGLEVGLGGLLSGIINGPLMGSEVDFTLNPLNRKFVWTKRGNAEISDQLIYHFSYGFQREAPWIEFEYCCEVIAGEISKGLKPINLNLTFNWHEHDPKQLLCINILKEQFAEIGIPVFCPGAGLQTLEFVNKLPKKEKNIITAPAVGFSRTHESKTDYGYCRSTTEFLRPDNEKHAFQILENILKGELPLDKKALADGFKLKKRTPLFQAVFKKVLEGKNKNREILTKLCQFGVMIHDDSLPLNRATSSWESWLQIKEYFDHLILALPQKTNDETKKLCISAFCKQFKNIIKMALRSNTEDPIKIKTRALKKQLQSCFSTKIDLKKAQDFVATRWFEETQTALMTNNILPAQFLDFAESNQSTNMFVYSVQVKNINKERTCEIQTNFMKSCDETLQLLQEIEDPFLKSYAFDQWIETSEEMFRKFYPGHQSLMLLYLKDIGVENCLSLKEKLLNYVSIAFISANNEELFLSSFEEVSKKKHYHFFLRAVDLCANSPAVLALAWSKLKKLREGEKLPKEHHSLLGDIFKQLVEKLPDSKEGLSFVSQFIAVNSLILEDKLPKKFNTKLAQYISGRGADKKVEPDGSMRINISLDWLTYLSDAIQKLNVRDISETHVFAVYFLINSLLEQGAENFKHLIVEKTFLSKDEMRGLSALFRVIKKFTEFLQKFKHLKLSSDCLEVIVKVFTHYQPLDVPSSEIVDSLCALAECRKEAKPVVTTDLAALLMAMLDGQTMTIETSSGEVKFECRQEHLKSYIAFSQAVNCLKRAQIGSEFKFDTTSKYFLLARRLLDESCGEYGFQYAFRLRAILEYVYPAGDMPNILSILKDLNSKGWPISLRDFPIWNNFLEPYFNFTMTPAYNGIINQMIVDPRFYGAISGRLGRLEGGNYEKVKNGNYKFIGEDIFHKCYKDVSKNILEERIISESDYNNLPDDQRALYNERIVKKICEPCQPGQGDHKLVDAQLVGAKLNIKSVEWFKKKKDEQEKEEQLNLVRIPYVLLSSFHHLFQTSLGLARECEFPHGNKHHSSFSFESRDEWRKSLNKILLIVDSDDEISEKIIQIREEISNLRNKVGIGNQSLLKGKNIHNDAARALLEAIEVYFFPSEINFFDEIDREYIERLCKALGEEDNNFAPFPSEKLDLLRKQNLCFQEIQEIHLARQEELADAHKKVEASLKLNVKRAEKVAEANQAVRKAQIAEIASKPLIFRLTELMLDQDQLAEFQSLSLLKRHIENKEDLYNLHHQFKGLAEKPNDNLNAHEIVNLDKKEVLENYKKAQRLLKEAFKLKKYQPRATGFFDMLSDNYQKSHEEFYRLYDEGIVELNKACAAGLSQALHLRALITIDRALHSKADGLAEHYKSEKFHKAAYKDYLAAILSQEEACVSPNDDATRLELMNLPVSGEDKLLADQYKGLTYGQYLHAKFMTEGYEQVKSLVPRAPFLPEEVSVRANFGSIFSNIISNDSTSQTNSSFGLKSYKSLDLNRKGEKIPPISYKSLSLDSSSKVISSSVIEDDDNGTSISAIASVKDTIKQFIKDYKICVVSENIQLPKGTLLRPDTLGAAQIAYFESLFEEVNRLYSDDELYEKWPQIRFKAHKNVPLKYTSTELHQFEFKAVLDQIEKRLDKSAVLRAIHHHGDETALADYIKKLVFAFHCYRETKIKSTFAIPQGEDLAWPERTSERFNVWADMIATVISIYEDADLSPQEKLAKIQKEVDACCNTKAIGPEGAIFLRTAGSLEYSKYQKKPPYTNLIQNAKALIEHSQKIGFDRLMKQHACYCLLSDLQHIKETELSDSALSRKSQAFENRVLDELLSDIRSLMLNNDALDQISDIKLELQNRVRQFVYFENIEFYNPVESNICYDPTLVHPATFVDQTRDQIERDAEHRSFEFQEPLKTPLTNALSKKSWLIPDQKPYRKHEQLLVKCLQALRTLIEKAVKGNPERVPEHDEYIYILGRDLIRLFGQSKNESELRDLIQDAMKKITFSGASVDGIFARNNYDYTSVIRKINDEIDKSQFWELYQKAREGKIDLSNAQAVNDIIAGKYFKYTSAIEEIKKAFLQAEVNNNLIEEEPNKEEMKSEEIKKEEIENEEIQIKLMEKNPLKETILENIKALLDGDRPYRGMANSFVTLFRPSTKQIGRLHPFARCVLSLLRVELKDNMSGPVKNEDLIALVKEYLFFLELPQYEDEQLQFQKKMAHLMGDILGKDMQDNSHQGRSQGEKSGLEKGIISYLQCVDARTFTTTDPNKIRFVIKLGQLLAKEARCRVPVDEEKLDQLRFEAMPSGMTLEQLHEGELQKCVGCFFNDCTRQELEDAQLVVR